MRDAVPPAAELRRQVANRVLDVYSRYGFEPISTPALENLEVLMGSQGGENEKLIFKVLKRGARLEAAAGQAGAGQAGAGQAGAGQAGAGQAGAGQAGAGQAGAGQAGEADLADLGLRFDLTVPLARFVANHLHELPMPLKVAHVGPVWRAERPQRGRYREFTQCDIDIIGEPSIAAEVELCAATVDALASVGIAGCTVRLNDRRLLRAAVERHLGQVDAGPVYIALDKLDKLGPDEVAGELARAGHDRRAIEGLLAALSAGEDGVPERLWGGATAPVAAAVRRTLEALATMGVPARFDPTLVRGMGYYTGQIFELAHPDVPYSLAGGGRYDGMAARFGAPPLPMCGFSIGFERICEMVDPGRLGPPRPKQVVACTSDEALLDALQQARARRQQEPDLVLSVVRQARNTQKQREDFQRLGYSYSQI